MAGPRLQDTKVRRKGTVLILGKYLHSDGVGVPCVVRYAQNGRWNATNLIHHPRCLYMISLLPMVRRPGYWGPALLSKCTPAGLVSCVKPDILCPYRIQPDTILASPPAKKKKKTELCRAVPSIIHVRPYPASSFLFLVFQPAPLSVSPAPAPPPHTSAAPRPKHPSPQPRSP